jgi:hypothetical protein
LPIVVELQQLQAGIISQSHECKHSIRSATITNK